jgi:DnaJ-class molecular chaperone
MPHVNGRRRGDLYVHLRVVVPSKLTGEQRKLIEEVAELGGGLEPRIIALNVRQGPDEMHSGASTTPIESAEPRRRHRYHLHICCILTKF